MFLATNLYGQNHQSVSLEPQFGMAIPHDPTVENIAPSRPISIQLRYAQTLKDSVFTSLYHCEFQKGFLLNYTDFRLPLLGKMMGLGYFLQPTIQLSKKFSMGLRALGGLAFATAPNQSKNLANASYSMFVNGYLSLGLQSRIELNERFSLAYLLQLNHLSNGGLNKPNWGLNWASTGIGLEYKLLHKPQHFWLPKQTEKRYVSEIAAFYSAPYSDTPTQRRLNAAGISFQLIKRGLLHGFSMGIEAAYDEMYTVKAMDKKQLELNPWLFAAFAGHEFLFGRFIFSQQVGVYTMKTYGVYRSPWYHRWGVNYYVSKNVGIGFSMKAHNDMANFIDARLIYQLE